MSDATPTEEEEDLKDRKLYAVAMSWVTACRAVDLSPADVCIIAATAIGIAIAQSQNELTDDGLAAWCDVVRATFNIEREEADERSVPHHH